MRPELVDGSVAEQDVKARDVKALAGGASSASRIRSETVFLPAFPPVTDRSPA
jgi:hypothetical protein